MLSLIQDFKINQDCWKRKMNKERKKDRVASSQTV